MLGWPCEPILIVLDLVKVYCSLFKVSLECFYGEALSHGHGLALIFYKGIIICLKPFLIRIPMILTLLRGHKML